MNEGKFTMRGRAGALGKTGKGTPQIGVELVVTQGEFTGETIVWYGYFSDAAQEITFRQLRTLGWEGDDLSNLAGIDKNEVTVYLKEEEYNGEYNLKVKGIYPLGGAGIANPMSDAEAKAFAAQQKGNAIASRTAGQPKPGENRKKPSRPKSPPQHMGQDVPSDRHGADDDIPF